MKGRTPEGDKPAGRDWEAMTRLTEVPGALPLLIAALLLGVGLGFYLSFVH